LCSFQFRLFQDAVQGSGPDIITGMSGNRDPPLLHRMFELPVASLGAHRKPPIVQHEANDLPDLQPRHATNGRNGLKPALPLQRPNPLRDFLAKVRQQERKDGQWQDYGMLEIHRVSV